MFIVFGSAQVQKAVDYIHNVMREESEFSQDVESINKFDETSERVSGLKESRGKVIKESVGYNR